MGLLAGVTCIVHYCILTLSCQPEFSGQSWLPLVLSFNWPSVIIASGVLALAGLSGVVVGDMQLRNIGIVGYVGVFLLVAALLDVLFYRAPPLET
jgi:hypothetical protein